MSNSKTVFFVVSLLLATSSAAPGNNKFDIKVPDGCGETGFCSIRPDGYDAIEEKINSLLSPYLIANVANRNSESSIMPERDPDNCPFEVIREAPAYMFIKHENKTKVDIIVQTKLFPQWFDYVRCDTNRMDPESLMSDNRQCFNRLGKNSSGRNTSGFRENFICQESMATRKLYVFDPEVNKIKPKHYSIPVCCSCQVRNNL